VLNVLSVVRPAELGNEQLGQRGCHTSNISSMDADLKSRLVSTEELMLAVNSLFTELDGCPPAAWWDRSCDIALLIGTFVHGLGNYEAMLNDETLPFADNIRRYVIRDKLCVEAYSGFLDAAVAARQVCDDALEASKFKARKEVQAAVAAAAAASTKIEKEAVALREGGIAAEAVISTMGEQRIDNLYEIQDGQDSHFITLPRLKRVLGTSIRVETSTLTEAVKMEAPDDVKRNSDTNANEDIRSKRRSHPLPMPDARVLDFRLQCLIAEIESQYSEERNSVDRDTPHSSPSAWPASAIVSTNILMRDRALGGAIGGEEYGLSHHVKEYAGIGLHGRQCGVSHKSLDDRSDFSVGAATLDLAQVATGPESPRYLRAIGVPITLSRFGILALVHADEKCLHAMLANEHAVFYGDRKTSTSPGVANVVNNDIVSASNADALSNGFLDVNEGTSCDGLKQEDSPGDALDRSLDGSGRTGSAEESCTMPTAFRDSSELRAGVCVGILFYGYPFAEHDGVEMHANLSRDFRDQCGHLDDEAPESLFRASRFQTLLADLNGSVDIPKTAMIKEYVEKFFLPHCLKLCLYGNQPTTRNARGSKGEYETACGTSRYPEPSNDLQSPLPDPCLPLTDQSIEAVGIASAVLRRVRLMRSIMSIASGKVPADRLRDVLHSPAMRQSMDGLPVWWCPWIHDAALLIHASTRGLFAIFKDRASAATAGPAFSSASIMQHIRSTFLADERVIPRRVLDASSPDDAISWMKTYAEEFPSLNVVERRLSFLCSKATENLDGDLRFDNLPMYDHGGWPRN
jgi:hypothetical protein